MALELTEQQVQLLADVEFRGIIVGQDLQSVDWVLLTRGTIGDAERLLRSGLVEVRDEQPALTDTGRQALRALCRARRRRWSLVAAGAVLLWILAFVAVLLWILVFVVVLT